MDNIVRKGLIQVSPQIGKIASGDKPKIQINFCPALPGDYVESFKIQIAHFEPETITLKGYGLYPALKLELERISTPEFKKMIAEVRDPNFVMDQDDDAKSTFSKILENDVVSEIDRKILSDCIMKNIEEKQTAAMSVDSSYADFRSDNKKGDTGHPQETGEGFNKKDNMTERSGFTRNQKDMRYEKRLIEKVVVGTYTLDFGNVVAGTKVSRTFKVYNVGKMPFNLLFDQKIIKLAGFTLSCDKMARFGCKDNNCITQTVTYTTKKDSKPGRSKYILPIEMQNGPKYIIEIMANVTVPDVKVSSNDIDFGPVICGLKKTIYVRFENQKEVNCIWTLNTKEDRLASHERDKKGHEPRFHMTPTSGVLPKYTKGTMEISFIPLAEKPYQQRFLIEITDNTRKCEIQVRGTGVTPNLEFFSPEMMFSPSLPYDENVIKTLEIKNKSDFDTELYSLDFDKIYEQEEKL